MRNGYPAIVPHRIDNGILAVVSSIFILWKIGECKSTKNLILRLRSLFNFLSSSKWMSYLSSKKNNIATLIIKMIVVKSILLRFKKKVNVMCLKFNSLSIRSFRCFDRRKIDLLAVKLSSPYGVKYYLIVEIFFVFTSDVVYLRWGGN